MPSPEAHQSKIHVRCFRSRAEAGSRVVVPPSIEELFDVSIQYLSSFENT